MVGDRTVRDGLVPKTWSESDKHDEQSINGYVHIGFRADDI